MKYLIYIILLSIILVSCKKYPETEKTTQEFCSLGELYFFDLFEGINNLFRRSDNVYIINFKDNQRAYIYKKGDDIYLYRQSNDTILYDLELKNEEFERKYHIKVDRIKEIIDICERLEIYDMRNRESEKCLSFYLVSCDVMYKKLSPPAHYKKELCENWYLMDEKR